MKKITTKTPYKREELLCPFCQKHNPNCVLTKVSYDNLGYAILVKSCDKIEVAFISWDTFGFPIEHFTCPNHKNSFVAPKDVQIEDEPIKE